MLWYSIALCAMGAATQGILINSSILAMFNLLIEIFFRMGPDGIQWGQSVVPTGIRHCW
jgi:hypothetical protein